MVCFKTAQALTHMLNGPFDMQDPSYPVYVDSSVIMGMTGDYDEGSKGFGKLQYMVCRPENDFFPDLSKVRTSPSSPVAWTLRI